MNTLGTKPALLVLQKRGHRAGAQTCLARLLRSPALSDIPKILITEPSNKPALSWLAHAAHEAGAQLIQTTFPSVRTPYARMHGNSRWAHNMAKQITQKVALVLANDLPEAPLVLPLAKRFSCTSAALLRSSSMQQKEVLKYQSAQLDFLFTVNPGTVDTVRNWLPKAAHTQIEPLADGLESNDFLPAKAIPKRFPARILVIGNEHPAKGWQDMVEAMTLLPPEQAKAIEKLDFLSSSQVPTGLLKLGDKLGAVIPRSRDFQNIVRSYDLVIAPSHRETFGMAVLETLAAGVPVLSSAVGVIERAIVDQRFMFHAGSPKSLANKLSKLIAAWPEAAIELMHDTPSKLAKEFSIEPSAQRLHELINLRA